MVKHSCLLWTFVNYGRKIWPRAVQLFTVVLKYATIFVAIGHLRPFIVQAPAAAADTVSEKMVIYEKVNRNLNSFLLLWYDKW
jgi:hypothetical protein